MINQLSYYLMHISNQNSIQLQEIILNDEIDYCLDGLTASMWENQIMVLLSKGKMPRSVLCDLKRFRTCFRTLLEFGITYSQEKNMQVSCEIKEFLEEEGKQKCFII